MGKERVKAKGPVRLYRFLNVKSSQYGAPFAMCDPCLVAYREKTPAVFEFCILDKIADRAVWGCSECGRDNRAGEVEDGS